MDRAYEQSKLPGNLVEFYKDGQQFETEMKRTIDGIPFIRLHGSIRYHMETDIPLILSSEQYAKFGQNRQRLFARLRDMAYEFPLIFCDYSIADPHIQTILFDIFDLSIARPNYYVVLPNISGIESRY